MKKAFEFLTHLRENNNREWFSSHKSEYDSIVKENKVFFNQIYSELQEYDNLKGIHIFRIYRDVRFSKDQTPYKTNFGAGYSRSKPMLRGGYYIQLEPGNSFVGGGFWGRMQRIYFVSVKNSKSVLQKLKKLPLMKPSSDILKPFKVIL